MMKRFDYSDYSEKLRELASDYIEKTQREYVKYFYGCKFVLDVACGDGIFLNLLKENNIKAIGVDSNQRLATKAAKKGIKVVRKDIFEYFQHDYTIYDGIFCSHFIEHLSCEMVLNLIEFCRERLSVGGILVLVFPNPASIRDQLFGFWKDPQHVRYYHSDLVKAILEHYGLRIVYDNSVKLVDNFCQYATRHQGKRSCSMDYERNRLYMVKKIWILTTEFIHKYIGINRKFSKLEKRLNSILDYPDECVLVAKKQEP